MKGAHPWIILTIGNLLLAEFPSLKLSDQLVHAACGVCGVQGLYAACGVWCAVYAACGVCGVQGMKHVVCVVCT